MDNTDLNKIIADAEAQKSRLKKALVGAITLVIIGLAILLYLTSHISHNTTPAQEIVIQNQENATTSENTHVTDYTTVKEQNNNHTQLAPDEQNSEVLSDESLDQINLAVAQEHKTKIVAPIIATTSSSSTTKQQQSKVAKTSASKVKTNNNTVVKINNPHTSTDALDAVLDNYDKTNKQTEKHEYYIQFAAFKDKDKLDSAKKLLVEKQLNPIIQPVDTAKGRLYRLRVGPFNNKEIAEEKYNKIKDIGITAIITGN